MEKIGTRFEGLRVLATTFNDKTGSYSSNNLFDGGLYYAELSTNPTDQKNWDFAALGKLVGRSSGLPKFYRLKITYHNKRDNTTRSVYATKGDKGRGGPNRPQIDLHVNLAKALNFPYPGRDFVTIDEAD